MEWPWIMQRYEKGLTYDMQTLFFHNIFGEL